MQKECGCCRKPFQSENIQNNNQDTNRINLTNNNDNINNNNNNIHRSEQIDIANINIEINNNDEQKEIKQMQIISPFSILINLIIVGGGTILNGCIFKNSFLRILGLYQIFCFFFWIWFFTEF